MSEPKPVDVEGLRALLAAAARGTWHVQVYDNGSYIGAADRKMPVAHLKYADYPDDEENAALIAAAVNALPALLDELTRLRASCAEHTAMVGTLNEANIAAEARATIAEVVAYVRAEEKRKKYRHATYGDACAHCVRSDVLEDLADALEAGAHLPAKAKEP
jgi:hypothetical protein